jgi:hypothetical protein
LNLSIYGLGAKLGQGFIFLQRIGDKFQVEFIKPETDQEESEQNA